MDIGIDGQWYGVRHFGFRGPVSHVSSFSMTDVKLPKLNLPVFNGDVLQWQSFWDQFVAAVDSTDLPDVSKFSYLRASLEGEVT